MLVGMQRAMIEDSRSVAMELAYERQRSFDLLDRISRVAGFMAHDFNNFLSIIKLNCERLSREMELDPRVQRLVAIIRDTAIRGSDITRSLMTLSRQRSDSCVSITIDSLIRENLAFFKTVVGSKLELQIHLDAGDPAVLVSRVGILNSLVNLLINARDAMADGGAITISTGLRRALLDIPGSKAPAVMQDYVAIEVADTGAGMSHDVLSKAFEPLFSTKAHGNGIGLASVLEFAREMGGDACLDSSLGKGARIYIYLPVSDGAAPDAASANVPIAHRHAAFGAKAVLLVEDEPYALEALSEMLEAEGLAVTACGSAAQAQAALAHGQYRVLLTDIIMPGESGANLARQACAQQPGLKVILMSGYVPDAEELQADWQFIRKPMDTQMLLEMIHAALAQPDFAG
jgi:nitrogen-specific signal transduction histidine kinase